MTTRKTAFVFGIGAAVSLFAQVAMAEDDLTKEQLATVKISMEQAIAKAKKAHPGTPVTAELETEGKDLVYEIEIVNGEQEMEVNVNATTGEVSVEK